MVYMNIYAHLKDFNIAILENIRREAATVRSSLNICNYTENVYCQNYLRKTLLRGEAYFSCFLTAAVRSPEVHLFG